MYACELIRKKAEFEMKFNASLMLANYLTRNIRCLNLLICVMLDLSLDIFLESMNFEMIYKHFFEVLMWSLMELSAYQGQGRCLSWLGHPQDWYWMGKKFGLLFRNQKCTENCSESPLRNWTPFFKNFYLYLWYLPRFFNST